MGMMRPFTQKDRDAVRRGHSRHLIAELWTPAGKQADLPVEDGSVQWTLSAQSGLRSGSMSIPGYEWFAKVEPGRQTWVSLNLSIESGSWWLGQWPVTKATATRPGGSVNLDLGDWSFRRSHPMGESDAVLGGPGETLARSMEIYMSHVLPPVTCTRDDSGGQAPHDSETIKLGGSVWGALVNLCRQRGMMPVMTSRQTVEVRDYVGPHTGTPGDTLDGAIVKETTAVDAGESYNKVIVQVDTGNTDFLPGWADETLSTGPYRYDRLGFGSTCLVIHESRKNISTPVAQVIADDMARYAYGRQLGVVKTHALEIIPMPWLEVGDWVRWKSTITGATVTARIETLKNPLTPEGTQTLTLRDEVVTI